MLMMFIPLRFRTWLLFFSCIFLPVCLQHGMFIFHRILCPQESFKLRTRLLPPQTMRDMISACHRCVPRFLFVLSTEVGSEMIFQFGYECHFRDSEYLVKEISEFLVVVQVLHDPWSCTKMQQIPQL